MYRCYSLHMSASYLRNAQILWPIFMQTHNYTYGAIDWRCLDPRVIPGCKSHLSRAETFHLDTAHRNGPAKGFRSRCFHQTKVGCISTLQFQPRGNYTSIRRLFPFRQIRRHPAVIRRPVPKAPCALDSRPPRTRECDHSADAPGGLNTWKALERADVLQTGSGSQMKRTARSALALSAFHVGRLSGYCSSGSGSAGRSLQDRRALERRLLTLLTASCVSVEPKQTTAPALKGNRATY